jgi:ribose/xylose/arabinose/galactoside ABC-type transport system permease subunit
VVQNLPVDSPWYVAIPVAFLVPMAVGGLCGLANGAMTVGFRMHPFIVTLSTMSMLQGIAVLWFPSTVPEAGKQLPAAFVRAMSAEITVGSGTSAIGLRWVPVFVMLVVVAIGAVFLHGLVAGRETYAIGGNPEAARFSGIRVWWATMRVYILMGLCAGVAAVVHLGKFNSTSTNDGRGYELLVIASAVVGGASLTGGRGTALGALLGTLVITLIDNGITVMHWATENTKVIIGAAIIVAVGIDRFSDYMARRGGRR